MKTEQIHRHTYRMKYHNVHTSVRSIRFKATEVSLSAVGCAPHLKKNS